MSGIQALVRLPIDQRRRDVAAGLNTATLISGYRGSPLGGFDMALERAGVLLTEHHVRFMPGVNEDLAATAVLGSQLANTFPGPRYDGVLGMWYGKGPGVDRSGDAFRHANTAGVGRHGGVLAVAGDDPGAKSSTVASASEFALLDAQMPILYPGNVQEVLELGLLGFALSRWCGSWVGLKTVTNVADAFSTVSLSSVDSPVIIPEFEYAGSRWAHTQNANLLAPDSIIQEREMHEGRSEAARRFITANDVNRVVVDGDDAWLGIVAAGKTYYDVVGALETLGIDLDEARRLGVRVLKLGALHPLDSAAVQHFARGLREILVIEEKRAFIELFLREALYGRAGAPLITGKRDETGAWLVPGYGELDTDTIGAVLRARLGQHVPAERLRQSAPPLRARSLIPLTVADSRTPYFCSGCPHSRSTVVPDGSIANGAVGCSTMAMWMDRDTENILHMGAEGVHWVGASMFSDTPHIFQNIGDGTFLHSGSLAIRQAVAAKSNITYKLLYNAAVAMTGGQRHDADMPVTAVAAALVAEGVARVLVVAHDPTSYEPGDLPGSVEVWHRDRVMEAQAVLREIPGVTVMIYDQPCAADLRRKRKRGLAVMPAHRIFINEAVCEGCGDCGAKSNCLSVQPVETPFGRKTQIHQASCNLDDTCTTGHCPAFVKVTPAQHAKRQLAAMPGTDSVPEPIRHVGSSVNVLMTGVGGTGVVTVNQTLGVAARLEGLFSTGLDQTGLAQKGGSVVSHLRIDTSPIEGATLINDGAADVLLAFDLVTAAQDGNLKRTSPARTVVVMNTAVTPTGPQVRSVDAPAPSMDRLERRIAASSRADLGVSLDGDGLSTALFGDHLPSNFVVLGAAYQSGLLPLASASIERAIELNGAGAATNIAAFRVGRLVVHDPAAAGRLTSERAAAVVRRATVTATARRAIDRADLPTEVREMVSLRVADLTAYQSHAYAMQFLDTVAEVARREPPGRSALTAATAAGLYRLMAYKDEYEVARLHMLAGFDDAVGRTFGSGARTAYLLQPPSLDRLGVRRKLELGPWFRPVLRTLATGRRLRGTRLDPFGRRPHRRLERGLADEYRGIVRAALGQVTPESYDDVVAIAGLADRVRGFDHVKERNIDAWRTASADALRALNTSPQPVGARGVSTEE